MTLYFKLCSLRNVDVFRQSDGSERELVTAVARQAKSYIASQKYCCLLLTQNAINLEKKRSFKKPRLFPAASFFKELAY